MILTAGNYHSQEARQKYMSASRYKDFCGSLGLVGCEARALAMTKGDWVEESTPAMKVSSYVDAHFSGTLAVFESQHPEILTQKGALKADYVKAGGVIERIERDPYFMRAMSGEKQIIFTAELFGVEWSVMIDSYIPKGALVDLKVMASIRKSHYVKDWGRMSFIRFYGYDIQAAIYQAVVRKATGDNLPFLIAVASKITPEKKYPDIEVIKFKQCDLDDILSLIEPNINKIIQLKSGEVEPIRCEVCNYCLHTKILTGSIYQDELMLDI